MGLFNFGKKKKEEERKKALEAQYEAMSLKDILQELRDNDWKNYDSDRRTTILFKYFEKLFGSPVEEGGFGLKDYPGFSEVVMAAFIQHDSYKLYKYTVNENEQIHNYKIEYLKNCLKRGCVAQRYDYDNAIRLIFPFGEEPLFTKAELRDPDFQLYHPWVLEYGTCTVLERKEFIAEKIKTIRTITQPLQLEIYGMFRQVDGVPTNEYVTVEDFAGIKSLAQLKSFLYRIRTRGDE